ncbi:paraquat-inducible protein A [Vibrio sp. CK2-1]|uniref:paraquat-inducible protein A n=1 Tax=Vibrio sp. CK2-1 TaxID=2912249 RepID=UPI00225E1CF4|nr:paraquat-inducible protein A [Vibrio sp. CK2-1]
MSADNVHDMSSKVEGEDNLSNLSSNYAPNITQQAQSSIICPCCDMTVVTQDLRLGINAHCPRCDTLLYRGKDFLLNTNLMLAFSGLLFFIPALFIPFITIRLINVNFSSTLVSGAFALFNEGFYALGILIFLCSSVIPVLLFASVIGAHWGLKHKNFTAFKYSLVTYQKVKHWWMIDVFLLSIAVAAFKLLEYSTVTPQIGLVCITLSQIIAITLIVRMSVRRYWEAWSPSNELEITAVESHCQHCHLSQANSDNCLRCHSPLIYRKPNSIQKTWAFLIAATVFLIPANFLEISIIFSNGIRYQDTIFSGVVSLTKGHIPIAIVIFVASILVPVAKIVGLAYILIYIQLKSSLDQYKRMKLYLFVKWIGKWSILDLFVIATTIALVDRDQILDFSPGPAAMAFAAVVVLTMCAAESLDPRLIWDTPSKTNNKNESSYEQ